VDTNIFHSPENRWKSDGRYFPWPLTGDGLFFKTEEGAEPVLAAALLKNEVKPNEFVLPYFYFLAESSIMKLNNPFIPTALRILLSGPIIEPFERATYVKDHVWVCPASVDSKDEAFQEKVRAKFFP
jgi:hypothetical protein